MTRHGELGKNLSIKVDIRMPMFDVPWFFALSVTESLLFNINIGRSLYMRLLHQNYQWWTRRQIQQDSFDFPCTALWLIIWLTTATNLQHQLFYDEIMDVYVYL